MGLHFADLAVQSVPAMEEENRSDARGRMLRSAFAVGALTLVSRVTGLLRETVHAHYLGTGLGADAFRVALLIPNVFRRLVGEGAVSSAFVPVFTRVVRQEPGDVVRFSETFFSLWSMVLLAVTTLGMALAPSVLESLGAIGVAWTDEKLALTSQLTVGLFPYLLLIGLAAVAGGILNARGIFALPSATSILYNLAFIAAGLLLARRFAGESGPAWAFTIGVLAGGLLQLLVLLPELWRVGIRLRWRAPFGHPGVREVLRLLLPATFGAGVYQLNVLVANFLAMRLPGSGAVSALGYAGRLMEFVLGVFVFALSTVSLTTLSRQAAEGDRAGFRATLTEVLELTVFITTPSAVGLFLLQEPVIALLLQTGRFDRESAVLTAQAFQWYVPGLVLVGLNRVIVAGFYAQKDVWTPVRIGSASLVVNAFLSWALMGPLGHGGIALASTLAALFQIVWLFARFRLWGDERIAVRGPLLTWLRAGAASFVMAGVVLLVKHFWIDPAVGRIALGIGVGAAIAAGAVVYFAAASLLGAPEARRLWRTLARRFRVRSG